jgi:DNA-binding transcriptional LysR family regulator
MDNQGEMGIFAKVVDEGSFSAAAALLNLTPSAISKQISRLEDRLGVRLLHRTTRRLSLTEEGNAFYQGCVRVLADIEEAERSVTQMRAAPRGTLLVNASIAFAQRQIVPLIPEFLARYPHIRVRMTLSDTVVDLVEEGVDVAIRIAEMADSSMIARKLAPHRRVVCASPTYLEKHGTPATPDDLIHHNCLALSLRSSLNEWEFEGPEGHRTVRVSGNFEANNVEALRKAAVAGLGLLRITSFAVAADIKLGRLVPVLTDCMPEERSSVFVVYPHNRHLSPKVRAFVDFLVETIDPNPSWEA